VTDFLVSGGDGLTMPQGAPKRSRRVLARDIVVAYVKEHRPLTKEVLGAGQQPRWTQTGSVRRAQPGE